MEGYSDWTEREKEYYRRMKETGEKYGDSEQLRKVYRQVLEDYHAGLISKKAYGVLYALCMDMAWPR
ncbi:hypothetical protein K280104A7_12060 [Candidatus Bariatricus faecipullorum]